MPSEPVPGGPQRSVPPSLPSPPLSPLSAEVEALHRLISGVIRLTAAKDAEDLVQEALLALLERLDTRRPVESLRGLAVKIARDTLCQWNRRRNRGSNALPRVPSSVLDETQAPPLSGSLSHEDVVDLRELIDRAQRAMSAEVRAVFLAMLIDAPPAAVLARKLGCTRNTVSARWERALVIVRGLCGRQNSPEK